MTPCIDQRSVQVGFRRVEVTGNQLLINGVAVVINGVNRHEIHPDRGRAITVDDIRADLLLMKRHHVNAVRTAHYPDAEEFYDLCDELGLYVVDEANIESHARWGSLVHDRRYLGALMERVSRMVLRDRSHPCVIAWSLGNESGDGAAHDAMAAWVRRTDPSRPVHYEGGFTFDLHAASPASDIVCPMYAPPAAIAAWAEDRARHAASADPVRVQPHDGSGRWAWRTTGRCSAGTGCRAASYGSGATTRCAGSMPAASACLPTAATSGRRSTTARSCATVWCRPIVCPIHCWPSSPR